MGSNLPAVNLGTGRTVVAVIKHFYGATCAVLDDGKRGKATAVQIHALGVIAGTKQANGEEQPKEVSQWRP